MVRQLQDKGADICGASLTITNERSEAIDFTLGLVEDVFSLFIVNPELVDRRSEIDLVVFLTIYTKEAWLATLAAAMASAFVYMSLHKWTRPQVTTAWSLTKLFLAGMHEFFLSLIQKKSSLSKMVCKGERLLLLTTSIGSFFLLTCYEGDVTATMTAGTRAPSLRSFQDVLDANYEIHSQGGTAYYDYFKNAQPDTIVYRIFEHYLIDSNLREFVKEQLDNPSKAAFFTSIFTSVEHKNSIFLKNLDGAVSTQLTFGLQKDSEFKDMFNFHLSRLKEAGVITTVIHKWLEEEKPDDLSKRIFQEEAMPLGYKNLFFPTMIMCIGISVCLVALCVERTLSRRLSTNVLVL